MEDTRPFLDFKAIKARASIITVLDRYGVQLARVNQTTLRGRCPLPTHASKSRDTFYVNEAKAVWYCHSASCKKNGNRAGGNVLDFVSLMDNIAAYEAATRLNAWYPATGDPATLTHEETVPDQPDDPVGNKPLAFRLKDVSPAHPLIQERGISIETATLFGIGLFRGKGSMMGRIVFELHENGNLIGYAGRTTLPVTDVNPKWLLGKGLRKTFLYGLERCDPAKPLIVCESFWGPPFFYERGLQAAAIMGLELSPEQERCLDPYAVITVALDNDAAADEKAARIIERLRATHKVLRARLME